MADESIASGNQTTKPKRKLKTLLIILMILIVIGSAGAGGFFFWRSRTSAHAARQDAKAGKSKSEKADDSEVKEVIELQPFIINLADRNETRYLRMTISLGVDETGEAKADPLFTTRVRNAILQTITTKSSEDVLTIEGKEQLRKDMLKAAQSAVDQPQVRAIYITDFIVQM